MSSTFNLPPLSRLRPPERVTIGDRTLLPRPRPRFRGRWVWVIPRRNASTPFPISIIHVAREKKGIGGNLRDHHVKDDAESAFKVVAFPILDEVPDD